MRTLAPLLLVTGCAAEPLSTHTSLMSDEPPVKEQVLCDPNVCMVYRCADTDEDGICDEDELVLATDPADHFDRPTFRDVLRKLGGRELPSFQEGRSMLVVLPTIGPDGQPVFGGEAMLPARRDLLKDIGVELPAGAPDLTDGFMLVRSVESANVVEYSRPPWTELAVPTPDTTRDSGTAESSMGEAFKGMFIQDFKFDSLSSDEGFRFSTFSFTDGYQNQWSGSSQTGPSSSTTKAETHTKNVVDSYEFHKKIEVHTEVTDSGTKIVTKTVTTTSVSPDGRHHTSTNVKTTEYTSSDGTEHVIETESGGRKTTVWWIDGFTPEPPSPEGDYPLPDGDTAYAHSDPDYVEYTASPEVIEAAVLMRGGPVRVVDPLSDEGAETFIPGLDTHGVGPISLYSPDAASTSISEPLFIRLPFDGDYTPDADTGPAPEKTTQNGQCIYCNQGGS